MFNMQKLLSTVPLIVAAVSFITKNSIFKYVYMYILISRVVNYDELLQMIYPLVLLIIM